MQIRHRGKKRQRYAGAFSEEGKQRIHREPCAQGPIQKQSRRTLHPLFSKKYRKQGRHGQTGDQGRYHSHSFTVPTEKS